MASEDIDQGLRDSILQSLDSYPRKDGEAKEEYAINGLGCYVLEVQIPGGGWICLNAEAGRSTGFIPL